MNKFSMNKFSMDKFYLVYIMDGYYVVKQIGLMPWNDGFRSQVVCFLNGSEGFESGMNVLDDNILEYLGEFRMSDFQDNFQRYCSKKKFQADFAKFKNKNPEYFV